MSKKSFWFILISLVLIGIFALSTYAQDEGFRKNIGKSLGYLTASVGGVLTMFSENPAVWMKVLIWIAMFAAFFYGGKEIKMPKNIAGTLAAILAFMVIIVVPGEVLTAIAVTYGGIVLTLLIAIPFFAIAYFTIAIGKPNAWSYWGLALGWIVFLLIMSALETSLIKKPEMALVGTASIVVSIIWVIGILVIIFLIVLGIIKMAGQEEPEAALRKAAGGAIKGAGSKISDWIPTKLKPKAKAVKKAEEKEEVKEEKLSMLEYRLVSRKVKDLKEIEEYIKKKEKPDPIQPSRNVLFEDDIRTAVEELNKIKASLLTIESRFLQAHILLAKDVALKAKQTKDKKLEREAEATIYDLMGAFDRIKKAIGLIEDAQERTKENHPKDARKLLENAIIELRVVLSAMAIAFKLEKQQLKAAK